MASALNAVEQSIPRFDDTIKFAVGLPYFTPLQSINRKQLSLSRRVRSRAPGALPPSPAGSAASPVSAAPSPVNHVPPALPSPPVERRLERKVVNQTCMDHEAELNRRVWDQKVPRSARDRVVEFTLSDYGAPPEDFVFEVLHFCQRFFPNMPFVSKPTLPRIKPVKQFSLARPQTNPLTEWEADDLFDGLDAVGENFPPHVWSLISFTQELVAGDALDDAAEGGPKEVDYSYFTSSWTDADYPKSFLANGCTKRLLGIISTAPFGSLDRDKDGTILRRTLRNTAALIMSQLAMDDCVTFECLMNKYTMQCDNPDLKIDGVLYLCPICLLKLASLCFSQQDDCLRWLESLESYFAHLAERGLSAFEGDLEWFRSAVKYVKEKKSLMELKQLVDNFCDKPVKRRKVGDNGRKQKGSLEVGATTKEGADNGELSAEGSEEEDWGCRLRRNGRRRVRAQTAPDRQADKDPDGGPESDVPDTEDQPYRPPLSSKRKRRSEEEPQVEGDETKAPESDLKGSTDMPDRRGLLFRTPSARPAVKAKPKEPPPAPVQPPEPSTVLPAIPKPTQPDSVGLKFSIACQALLKSAAAARTSLLRISPESTEAASAFLARVCPRLVNGFPDKRFFLSTADPIVAGSEQGVRFEDADGMGEIVREHLADSKTLFICCEEKVAENED